MHPCIDLYQKITVSSVRAAELIAAMQRLLAVSEDLALGYDEGKQFPAYNAQLRANRRALLATRSRIDADYSYILDDVLTTWERLLPRLVSHVEALELCEFYSQ